MKVGKIEFGPGGPASKAEYERLLRTRAKIDKKIGPPQSPWIKIEDGCEMPGHGRAVIGYDQFYGHIGPCSWYGRLDDHGHQRMTFDDGQKDDCHITHWMPLPEPPAEE